MQTNTIQIKREALLTFLKTAYARGYNYANIKVMDNGKGLDHTHVQHCPDGHILDVSGYLVSNLGAVPVRQAYEMLVGEPPLTEAFKSLTDSEICQAWTEYIEYLRTGILDEGIIHTILDQFPQKPSCIYAVLNGIAKEAWNRFFLIKGE